MTDCMRYRIVRSVIGVWVPILMASWGVATVVPVLGSFGAFWVVVLLLIAVLKWCSLHAGCPG